MKPPFDAKPGAESVLIFIKWHAPGRGLREKESPVAALVPEHLDSHEENTMWQHPRRQHPAVSEGSTSTLPLEASGIATDTASIISAPASAITATGITFATPSTTYTVLTSTNTRISLDGTSVVTTAVAVTNHASFTSLTASQSKTTTTHHNSSSATGSAASASSTSQTSHKSASKSNTNILIPAIVAPVVVILLASFGVFWFLMRRRHHREMKKANFVMTPREKLPSTNGSARSSGADGEAKSLPHKIAPAVGVKDTTPHQQEESSSPPPAYASSAKEIGVARALTSQDERRHHISPRTDSAQGHKASPRSPHVAAFAAAGGSPRNFSSPNPNARSGPVPRRDPPPNPSFHGRNSPGPRHTQNAAVAPTGQRPAHPNTSPVGPNRRNGPRPDRRGPSPGRSRARGPDPHAGPGSRPDPGPDAAVNSRRTARNPDLSSSRPPRSSPRNVSDQNGPGINPTNSTRAAAPPPINTNTTPVGAFNGAGPISQYSPIVRDTPQKDLALRTSGLGPGPYSSPSTTSPRSAGGLTNENTGTGNRSFLFDPTSSPDHISPPSGLGINASSPGHRPRISAVSELSADDYSAAAGRADRTAGDKDDAEYEDDDFKSEVSSLHEESRYEFDRWDDHDRHTPSRDGGLGHGRSRSVSPIR